MTSVLLESADREVYGGTWEPDELEYLFQRVPESDLTAKIQIGTRELIYPIGAGEGPYEVWAPSFGTLEATLSAPLNRKAQRADLRIVITEIGDPAKSFELREQVAANAAGELRLSGVLLPGRYLIEATWVDHVGDDEAAYPTTSVFSGETEILARKVTRIDLAR